MSARFLTVKLSGQELQVPILHGNVIPATALAKIKIPQTAPAPESPDDTVPLRFYDPGFKNTAVCNTKISEIDGINGKLYYRGYDIEVLFEKSSYLEVSYLLIDGELPTNQELTIWQESIMKHTYLHSSLEKQMSTFRYDCHPMGQLIATVSALSTFTPDANPCIVDTGMFMKPKMSTPPTTEEEERDTWVESNRKKFVYRALGKIPTISAAVYRHRIGRNYNHPMPHSVNYCENLLYMMHKLNEPNYIPEERLVKILDKLFILLAEHGVNCSTVMMRHLVSSGVDPYTALSGAAGALFGERKSSSVISMIRKIGSIENIDKYLEAIKSSTSSNRLKLMGFGHRIYKKAGDPRVKLCKQLAEQLFDVVGLGKNAKIALALEEKVAGDAWFIERNLFPNVDFWTGIMFDALEFPSDMFPVWMVIPRISGFIAHAMESLDDPEYKIFRPRQIYVGPGKRRYESSREGETDDDPAIASPNKDTVFRPSSFQTNRHDEREGLQTALEDFYNELGSVDFASQFESEAGQGQRESKLGWSLRSWVRKRFGVTSSPLAQTIIDNMQQEIKELKLDSGGSATAAATIHPIKSNSSGALLAGEGSQGQSTPDLLAGSSHSRVIDKR